MKAGNAERIHLWQGNWLSDSELAGKIDSLPAVLLDTLKQDFELCHLLDACQGLSDELNNRDGAVFASLSEILKDGFQMDKTESESELAALAQFLSRKDLEEKLTLELAEGDPFSFSRRNFRKTNFESWAALGFLVHIAPTNAVSVGALSVIEGLLCGNVNFLKTGGEDAPFAQHFLRYLLDKDNSGTIACRVIACRISSKEQELLKQVLSHASGVVAWGDEGAISGIRALSPLHARFIDWGPKISFAYFASESLNDEESLSGLALDTCRMEQQACSSPQIVYVETHDKDELLAFARRFSAKLADASASMPVKTPSAQEQAEITSVTELCRLESCLGLTDLIEADDGSWRILLDYGSVLKASPLYRTIWVKPLLRDQIVEILNPFRFYLQTVGLACGRSSVAELSEHFVRAGALRITGLGRMLESYNGEPHDGVYALQRYSRRISMQLGSDFNDIAGFAELKDSRLSKSDAKAKIMSKEDFQSMQVDPHYGQLFFKSGGSSGDPKLSIFNYDDYHLQMEAAAHGLLAAGLDLQQDRCMNLFFAGGLYGGFVSFFSILEALKAIQFPMAAATDTAMVAETIIKQKCNVLLGMPSYIIQLFSQNAELFKEHKTVEKIFYGGEHFNESQKRHFQKEFGVKIIRSAGYGSVDAGPIGYQCVHCSGSVHHLHSRLHILEILDLEKDEAVKDGDPGRVVLSCLARAGQKIERYDIGDMARIVKEPCPCGRRSSRFELLGRHGDVFRVGSAFFNYGKFAQICNEVFDYAGELQIVLRSGNGSSQEKLVLLMNALPNLDPLKLKECILENYEDLNEIVVEEGLLELKVEFVAADAFSRTAGSGKLRRIVDERSLQK